MKRTRLQGWRNLAMAGMLGSVCAFGSCNLSEFTSTSTVTLSGREVVSFLVRSWLLTPIETAVNNGINNFFDQFEDNAE